MDSQLVYYRFFLVFFVKQKAAYVCRISDWSSDVCSSDLSNTAQQVPVDHSKMKMDGAMPMDHGKMADAELVKFDQNKDGKISKSEVPAKHAMTAHFGMLDADKDGSLSQAEFAKHHEM